MHPIASRRAPRALSPAAIAAAFLSALLMFVTLAVVAPQSALGASTTTANCSANLRSSASTRATIRGSIPTGTKVTVAASVTGSSWKASCAGRSVSGSKWLRISAINGKSVASLYGVSSVYAAAGLFKPITTTTTTKTMAAACSANLRTSASVSATRKATISTGTKVTAVATVSGGSWRATCAGTSVSGSKWLRISAINGKSVKSLYGVTYLYAASGLFKLAAAAPSPPPPPQTLYAGCDDVRLRASASTSATLEATIDAGTTVTSLAKVTGGSWTAECGGRTVSGNTWYRISAVNGTASVTRYGVTYVYGATGLFSTTAPAPAPAPEEPAPEPAPAMLEGIDVSRWQGTIDWTKVRAAGKRFAFLKASEDDDWVDPTYATNRSKAKAAGVVVGAYHFAQPTAASGDAIAEADHFVHTAGIVKGELLPVLDLEVTNGLGPTALQAWTKAFLQRVYEKTGVRAGIYVSPAFWKTSMGDTTWFAANGYKVLWTAHWTTASAPAVPANNWGGRGWTFWQYSATGTVPGISTKVDLNRYNGSDLTPVLVP